MSVVMYDRDNLVTATKPLITDDSLQLEAGNSVVRGQLLKKGTTGVAALAADTDTAGYVALETVDATSAAKYIVYALEGSFLASEMVAGGTATIAGQKDKLRDAGILVF